MKKKNILTIIGIFIIATLIFGTNVKTSLAASKTYTRKQVQDIVISTALSYLNNNRFTEYDQTSMDNFKSIGSTINWRNLNVEPEEVSRSNLFSIDCSSFSTIVYLYSLGYDFTEHYNIYKDLVFYKFNASKNSFTKYTVGTDSSKGPDNLYNAYMNYGKGMKVKFFIDIVKKDFSNIQSGKIYNGASKGKEGVFYYQVTGQDDKNKTIAYNKMIELLQPGDLVLYRTTEDKGHAMLYIGNTIDSTNGVIHSTGSDYEIGDAVSIGDDEYSVRYDDMNLLDVVIKNNKKIDYFAIMRPINKYCKSNSCTLDNKASTNNAARVDLKWLRTEQYASTTNTTITSLSNEVKEIAWSSSSYNSVNVGDTIQYNTTYIFKIIQIKNIVLVKEEEVIQQKNHVLLKN